MSSSVPGSVFWIYWNSFYQPVGAKKRGIKVFGAPGWHWWDFEKDT